MNTTMDVLRKRELDSAQKRIDEAKEGKVPLGKWKNFKAEYPHATPEDCKAIRKREKEIAAQSKGKKFGESRDPKAAKEIVEKATRPPQAKNLLGATPGQQDDLLCANQMNLT